MDYRETYASWRDDPEAFWLDAAKAIDWDTPPTRAFDPEAGVYGRWFPDAHGNTCHNCVDRHVEAGHGERTAIVYDSPVTGTKRTVSYAELLREVSALAGALRDMGVRKGDPVIIYMPMVPEAAFAMLACARIGAVHSVVFGGFASNELAARIDDSGARVIVTASCGIEPNRVVEYKPLLDEAIAMASTEVTGCLVLQRERHRCELVEGRDRDYAEAVEAARGRDVPCESMAATDPLYILYTSGTTGRPKGVVRDTGGHMVALRWTMDAIYGVEPGETYWAASDVGWVVGHSYIVYAPLLAGCTTVLFEGKPVGTPDAGAFWRVMAENDVVVFFTAPTAFRAIRRADPDGEKAKEHDLSKLRAIFLAGERADPPTVEWIADLTGVPVLDHWWQTETGWAITANTMGLAGVDPAEGSPGVPMPGFDVRVLSDEGEEVEPGTLGNVAIKLPLPPSCLPTLWRDEERFREAYLSAFPGYYATSDAGMVENDHLFIMARTDDVINVAGHRLSTGAMEEAIMRHPAVAECAVVGVADELKGQLPVAFAVLRGGDDAPDAVEREAAGIVRERIGPVAAFRTLVAVPRLPKTRSGKTLRATIAKIADGHDVAVPATIDDPAILDEIRQAWNERAARCARSFTSPTTCAISTRPAPSTAERSPAVRAARPKPGSISTCTAIRSACISESPSRRPTRAMSASTSCRCRISAWPCPTMLGGRWPTGSMRPARTG